MIDKIAGNAISNSAIITSVIADLSITESKLANASVDISNFLTSTIDQFRVVKLTGVNYPSGTAAAADGGETITVVGEGFAPGAKIYIGNLECSTNYVSSEILTFTSPARTPGIYWLTVTNYNGESATKPNGIVFDGPPVWLTPAGNLGIVNNLVASNIALRANSLGTINYSIDSGYLPPGLTLSTNGFITGILPTGTSIAENYFFRVRATNNNGPYSSRSFFLNAYQGIAVNNIIYPGNRLAASVLGGDIIGLSGVNFNANINVFVQGTTVTFTRANANFISFTMPALTQSVYSAATSTRTETYTYNTNGIYTFRPTIAGNLEAIMWGAGAGTSVQQGGAGGFSRAIFPVVLGTTYYVVVGQAGGVNLNNRTMIGFPGRGATSTVSGGTGGGFSGIFANSITQANAVIMAGGGGGASQFGNGGAGGGTIGQSGSIISSNAAANGGGQSSGGTAGIGNVVSGLTGLAFNGASALDSPSSTGPGGGGGGWFGGGSGAASLASGTYISGSGGGGSGFINSSIVITGNTLTGNQSVPPNNSDSLRGLAGNPQTDGRVILNFTYPTSTDIYLTNPDGQLARATVRYSKPVTPIRPVTGPLYMFLPNGSAASTGISIIGSPTVRYDITNNSYPAVQFDDSAGIFYFDPSLAARNLGQGLYPINVSITNQENISSTQTYNVLVRNNQFANLSLEYLLVGGGGGGGWFGGGGAGGVISGNIWANLVANLETVSYSIVVGQGGISGQDPSPGSPTFISSNNQILVKAEGGGSGGSLANQRSGDGASTGGAAAPGGVASTNTVSGQGNSGGNSNALGGGGGGGAAATGGAATNPQFSVFQGGAGGAGLSTYSIWGQATGTGQQNGSNYHYAGGGGGAGVDTGVVPWNWTYPGAGGLGGGGSGIFEYGDSSIINNSSGMPNTGGGAGAVGNVSIVTNQFGGSGIAIIRYLGQQHSSGGTVTSLGGYTYHTFRTNGIFNPYGLLTETSYTGPLWITSQGNLGIYGESDNISVTLSSVGASSNVYYAVTAGSLPDNITLNANTGLISGAFTVNSIGNSVFTISSLDQTGASSPRLFFINVLPVPKIINVLGNSTTIVGNIGNGDLVTITGSNFINGAVVYLENTVLPTTFISANVLTFTAPIITGDTDYNEGGNALIGTTAGYWTPTTTYTMTDFGGVPNMTAHGYNASTIFTFSYPNLPRHDQIRYQLRWHLVDSLDGETSNLNIDGVRYLTFTKVYNTPPSVSFSLLANNAFTVASYSYRPWANGAYGQDGYINVDTGWITHTASNISIQHFIGADQVQTDEAEYLSNVRLQTRSLSGGSSGGPANVRVVNPNGTVSANFLVFYSSIPAWITPEGSLGIFGDLNLSTNIAILVNSLGNVSVISGSLPPGLSATMTSFSNVTISGNILSGANAQYNFTLRITDAEGQSADRSFSAQVSSSPKIYAVINPPGGYYDPQYMETGVILGQDFVTGCNVVINNVSQTTNFVNSQCITFTTKGEPVLGFTTGTQTYSTAGFYTWTVPDNARLATVYLWGGGGGGGGAGGWSYGSLGGAGGAAYGTITVTPGSTLGITVGGPGVYASTTGAVGGGGRASVNGSDNRYGAGGGGYSGIFTSNVRTQANAIIIAGGGGGGGSSRAGTGNQGGAGGGLIGQDGASPYDGKTAYRGRGGTQTDAGADASSDSANTSGNQGALQGGNPRTNSYGGAGGGGYWGGSAGGYSESNTMAGGGGGSGYLHPTLVTNGILYSGNLTTPGNASDILRGTAGNPGVVAGSSGAAGKVVINYISASSTTAYQLRVVNADNVSSSSTTFVYTTPPFWVTSANLGPATVGTDFYSSLITVGDIPIIYSILDNPSGLPLVLNSVTGNLSLRSSEAFIGNRSFTIRATDANLQYRDRQFTITTVLNPIFTSISYPLSANTLSTSNLVLSNVSITNTSGGFVCSSGTVAPGDRILVSGRSIIGNILAGYTDPRIYWVSTTPNNYSSSSFSLANSVTGDSLATVVGNTSGLTFTRIFSQSNVFSSYGGEIITLSGKNFAPGARMAISNLTPVTGNAIYLNFLSTTLISNTSLQFTTLPVQSGFYNLSYINTSITGGDIATAGAITQTPYVLRFSMPPYWETQANLNFDPGQGLLTALAESSISYRFWNNTNVNNVNLFAQTGQLLSNLSVTSYTANGTYTLTPGTTSNVLIKVWGGGGGTSGSGTLGGGGGYTTGFLNLQAGTTYRIVVGSGGKTGVQAGIASIPGGPGQAGLGPSGPGGTGGGYSGIFVNSVTQSNALLIAGGGGGGAWWDFVFGGAGGGSSGQVGVSTRFSSYSEGGGGGTQSAGGYGAGGADSSGGAGSALKGGDAPTVGGPGWVGGGGGGGGYFGGGAGASGGSSHGAGGGGSGYFNTSLVIGGSTTVGSRTTPGNNSDVSRNVSGNPAVDGAVVIISSTIINSQISVAATNEEGQVTVKDFNLNRL